MYKFVFTFFLICSVESKKSNGKGSSCLLPFRCDTRANVRPSDRSGGARPKRSAGQVEQSGTLHHFELSRHADKGRHAPKKRRKKDTSNCVLFRCDSMGVARRMVEVAGLEPATSWSRTKRATNCATPRKIDCGISLHLDCHIIIQDYKYFCNRLKHSL